MNTKHITQTHEEIVQRLNLLKKDFYGSKETEVVIQKKMH